MNTGGRRHWPAFLPYLVLLAGFGAFLVFWSAQRGRQAESVPAPPAPVRVYPAETADFERVMKVPGVVESERMVTVLPRIGGLLDDLLVKEGDTVQAGQTVARIDTGQYQPALDQARSAHETARAAWERSDRLFKAGSTTQQSHEQARAQFEAARSQLELARLQMSYTTLVSPVSGVVLQTNAQEGSLVGPQVPILTVASLGDLVVTASVPEDSYRLFVAGEIEEVRVTVPALGGLAVAARMEAVAPIVQADTKTFQVTVRLSGETGFARPGMYAQAVFVIERRENVPVLPLPALVGGTTLWHVDPQGRARPLRLEEIVHNDTFLVVPQEYREHRFILEGQHFLKDGQPVRILEGGGRPAP